MKRGIVITTSKHTYNFLADCLRSVRDAGYPILVVYNDEEYTLDSGNMKVHEDFLVVYNNWNGFELGGIKRGAEFFDEFIHLMDTTVVLNTEMIETMFKEEGSVYLCNRFFSYLGKYKKEIVDQIGVPKVTNKEEAIRQELEWNRRYLENDPKAVQFYPQLPITTDIFEEKYGRINMILSNGFIIKYKARWK